MSQQVITEEIQFSLGPLRTFFQSDGGCPSPWFKLAARVTRGYRYGHVMYRTVFYSMSGFKHRDQLFWISGIWLQA